MTNIHPLLVHFPIAFLVLYSFLELISTKKLSDKIWLLNTKAILVIAGFIGGLLAASSGEAIEDNFPDLHNLIETHSFWAGTTNAVFGVIAVLYLIKILSVNNVFNFKLESILNKIWVLIQKISYYILNNRFIIVLAIIVGFVAVTITGALGAAIVYGPDIDPIVKFIYNLVM